MWGSKVTLCFLPPISRPQCESDVTGPGLAVTGGRTAQDQHVREGPRAGRGGREAELTGRSRSRGLGGRWGAAPGGSGLADPGKH